MRELHICRNLHIGYIYVICHVPEIHCYTVEQVHLYVNRPVYSKMFIPVISNSIFSLISNAFASKFLLRKSNI